MGSISIFSINVRSIKATDRRNMVLTFLSAQQADVFMLQECSLPFSKRYGHLSAQWTHGPSYWSGGSENRAVGVAILVRGNRFTVDSVQELVCGRLLLVDGSWAGEPVRLINVYGPVDKNERMDFFQTLRPHLATTRAVFLAGDFNCPLERNGHSTYAPAQLDKTSKLLKEMVTEASLKDSAGTIGTGSANHTWIRPDGTASSRIDFVFTSRAVKQSSHSLVSCFFSDHRAVYFEGALGDGFPPGPGSWKLNCTLLENEELMEELREEYVLWREQQCHFKNVGDWWEFVKVKFRSFFQARGRQQVCDRRKDFRKLQGRLQCLQGLQLRGWNVREDLEETKKGLKRHFEEEARRIVFRSKVENMEKGEQCNAFFFRKLHSGHTPLTELRDETGTIRKGKKEVMEVVSDYYTDLYSPKTTDDEVAEKFLSGITNTLDPAGTAAMEDPLVLEELHSAAKSFRRDRTPGSDGLPAELYVALWDLIGPDLLLLYEEMVAEGRMPPSLRESMITILYKRKGERNELKNWRPISLLNVDYKILAKVLANRLRSVIGRIIHQDQTCGIPGRRIADSLALVRDTVHYIQAHNVHGALVSLDQEKAFDRVSHGFMNKVLRKFGLGELFCSYVNLMYLDISSSVLVNGWKTDPFPVLSGVRQGCPLSPLLFVCCIELFAESIRQNPEIRGITAPGPGRRMVKCSLYMDDVTVFCADEQSIKTLAQTCEDFGRASGAKVNCGKSEALLFGNWHLTSTVPFNVRPDFIKILGVWFGAEGAALKSWEERLSKMKQKFGLWSLRNLTIEGKTLVLRSEILPVLQYLAQAWPPRINTRKAITRAVFHFIWGSKMDRVKRAVMYKEPHKGGKGVPDIPTMLMASFASNCVRRTLSGKEMVSAGHSMSRFFLLRIWRKLGWDKWDNSMPYTWKIPWFYQDTEDFIVANQLAGVKPDLWRPKVINKLIRAKDETEGIPGLPESTCKFVWKNVSSQRLTNQHKDLAWKAIQGGLPVRAFMHARGLNRFRHCPMCVVADETPMHLFWDCPFAQNLLDVLEPEIRDCLPRNAVTHCGVLYGLFHGNFTMEEIQRAWRLMSCFKDAVWCARNRFVLRREKMSYGDCRRLILSLLRDYDLKDYGGEEEEEDDD